MPEIIVRRRFAVGLVEPGYANWYSDGVELAEPQTIELGPRTGVFGVVRNEAGAPLGTAQVVLHTPFGSVLSGFTSPSGEFEFPGVTESYLWGLATLVR